jgi:hypothetical protein
MPPSKGNPAPVTKSASSLAGYARVVEEQQPAEGQRVGLTTHCRSLSGKSSARWADGSAIFRMVESRTISCVMATMERITQRRPERVAGMLAVPS